MTSDDGTVLPLAYYEGFLDFLAAHRERIEIVTYADLAWGRGDDYHDDYEAEWRRWRGAVKSDPEARQKTYVLLQHDVDARPERTATVLRLEAERGLRANVMIFNRLHDRERLANDHVVEYLDYDVDVALLGELERSHGFVVGYHANAYEQALWNARRARRRFRRDVRELRRTFDIRVFSAHGGVPAPDGSNNASLEITRRMQRSVRWVCTGHTCRFKGSYSDGGLDARWPLADRDLRDFVRTWRPGGRYRVLTHPQYYGATAAHPAFADVPWYAELFASPSPAAMWEGVTLSDDPIYAGR